MQYHAKIYLKLNKSFYPVLFEQENCIDWINFCRSLTEIIAFSGTNVTCYPLNFGNLIVNPVSLPVDRKISKGQSRDNYIILLLNSKGDFVVVIVWQLDLQLPVQSVPITTNVVSSNPTHGEVYSIQNYVIKFVSDFRQVGGFLRFPPPIKLTARYN